MKLVGSSDPDTHSTYLWVTVFTLLTCTPYLLWILKSVFKRKILAREFFNTFSEVQWYWYMFATTFVILSALSRIEKGKYDPGNLIGIVILILFPFILMFALALIARWQKSEKIKKKNRLAPNRFALYLGESTGSFKDLSHGASIKENQGVSINLRDAAQNICIFGGIGSGKTTRAVYPLLVQLLDLQTGGLIFDIKGDFCSAALGLAKDCKRDIEVIGPEKTSMNLLSGLTPEVASSFLKSTFLLNASGKHDAFWFDTASELCRNALGVLSFFDNKYSLSNLHAYLFDKAEREQVNAEALKILMGFSSDDKRARLLKSYLNYHEAIFLAFDEKVKSGVNATVAQVLAPFNHPDLVDAFCTDDSDSPLMEEVLEGKVFLVDMPLQRWGLGGKVAYNFIKLRFFNVVQRRNVEFDWNKDKPVFFICDEFQEIVSANKDGLSDLNFWDKSRSSNCIGIISAQAVSSFYAAIGSHDLADALLQNFRQKICFRTEDSQTIEKINHLLGKVEVVRDSVSHSTSSDNKTLLGANTSTSKSSSVIEKSVINPQIFRQLGSDQAVALLSINGLACDDIMDMPCVFMD